MATPQFIGGYGEAFSAASLGSGTQTGTLTITEAEVLAAPGLSAAKFVFILATYRIIEPVSALSSFTGPSGLTAVASNLVHDSGTPNRYTLYAGLWAGLVKDLNATVSWTFNNANNTGRMKLLAFAYDRAALVPISAPTLGAVDSSSPYITTSATLGAPVRRATVCQFTVWSEAFTATNPTVSTANSFTQRDTLFTEPTHMLLDASDVTGTTDYATVQQTATGSKNLWITMGAAIGNTGGIYVDGAVHLS